MTSIITNEIEERYPYPDNGERRHIDLPIGDLAAYAGPVRLARREALAETGDAGRALAVYAGTSGMSVEEVLPLWPDMNPDAKAQYRLLARLAITAARAEALK